MDAAIITALISAAAAIVAAVVRALVSRRKKEDDKETSPTQVARAERKAAIVSSGAEDKSKRVVARSIAGANIIQADNVVFALDFFGLLLDTSGTPQEVLHEMQLESLSSAAPDVGRPGHIDDLRRVLSSVLEEVPGEERRELVVDTLCCIGSVVDKYRGHEREYDFPYGLFCRDLVESLGNLDIANTILTTPTLLEGLEDNKPVGVYLKNLSRLFPEKDHLLEHPTGFYLHQTAHGPDIHFVTKFGDGWVRSQEEHAIKHERDLLSRLLGKDTKVQGSSDAKKLCLESHEIRFSERKIVISGRFFQGNEVNFADFDFSGFATFVIAIVTDFMLLSLAALQHDESFRKAMDRLTCTLQKVGMKQGTPS